MLCFFFSVRKIVKMDCQWHHIYKNIHQIVQNEVKVAHGSNVNLFANDMFDCNKCITENKMEL